MKKPKNVQFWLPENFSVTELGHGPTFEQADDLLDDYCSRCTRSKNCPMQEGLREAMAENFPYWSQSFVAVRVPTFYHKFDAYKLTVLCKAYQDPQLNLPGFRRPRAGLVHVQGVERMMQLAKQDEVGYIAVNGDSRESL